VQLRPVSKSAPEVMGGGVRKRRSSARTPGRCREFRGAVCFVALLVFVGSPGAEPTLPAGADPVKVAQELVAKLRSATPQENSVINGTLTIKPKEGEPRKVPVECTIRVEADFWRSSYQTYGSNGVPERAVVVHRRGKPNEYLYARGTNVPKPLAPAAMYQPVAASDFALPDFGMDFLHWPLQRIVKTEMIKSRWANVLESLNPAAPAGGYTKVISWLDKESGGPLKAEAFNAQGKRVKEFEIGRVKKVEGEWQLKDMQIRDLVDGSRTTLEFDLRSRDEEPVGAAR
jgi:outer membrane lipoprotein-sorting protein